MSTDREREIEKEKKARQTEKKKDNMGEKASTVAYLIYSITQQVSLCLPNSLNQSGSIESIRSHKFH